MTEYPEVFYSTLCAMLLLAATASATSSGVCRMYVAENGYALVMLVIEGGGVVVVPLPVDVPYPRVEGAIYVQSTDGVEVSLGVNDTALLAYKSGLLTSKTGGIWNFMLDMPLLNQTEATLSLPKDAQIMDMEPRGVVKNGGNTTDAYWTLSGPATINVTYTFTEETAIPKETPTPTTTINPVKPQDIRLMAALFFALVLAAFSLAAGALYIIRRRMTKANQARLLKTLGENERLVVETLLKNGGGMRRNELERVSGMAKSSLAAVVNNLERKNIIIVDRRYTTHYVEVAETFRKP